MNRIERMLWEETNMNEITRLKPESHAARLVKTLLLIAFVVGLITLLVGRPWPPSMHEARVQAPVAAHVYEPDVAVPAALSRLQSEVGPLAHGVPADGPDAARRGARRGDTVRGTY